MAQHHWCGPTVKRTTRACVLAVLLTTPSVVPAQQVQQPQSPPVDYAFELQTRIGDGFTIAAVGDLILAYPPPHASDPSFRSLVRTIREADVAYANFEAHVLDLRALPVDRNSGFVGPPEVAAAVKEMGFDVVGRSNNHSNDFQVEGLLASDAFIREAGLVTVGSGPTYRQARAPGYFQTAKGRAAFVVASSSYGRAPVSADTLGRGGSSALRTTRCTVVPAALEAEYRAREECVRVAAVDKPYWSYEMNQDDLEAILGSVREGKMKSHFLAVGIHAHQAVYEEVPPTPSGNTSWRQDPTTPDFLQEYARATIDAGADAFFGTGPHLLRGIEIYKGRPIFYGLGEFFRQMGIIGPAGSEPVRATGELYDPMRYRHIVAVATFNGGEVSEIRLYPIDLGWAAPLVERGVPRGASPEVAQEILTRLQELSAPFGTTITIEGNVGVIRP